MARAMFQVLVLPFRRNGAELEFAAFKRADSGAWQMIAGGGEDGESIEQSAAREADEEAGIPRHLPLRRLQSMCTIPVYHFKAVASWPDDVYVVPEHAFSVDCTGQEIRLSTEHVEVKWGSYEEIHRLLKWDSNRNALWELNARLRRNDL